MRIPTVLLTLAGFAGCGSGSSDSPSAPAAATIVVTRTGSDTVDATADGGVQSTAITFNSQGTNAIHQLSVTDGLALLPAGWQGPSSFSCSAVDTGSGCRCNTQLRVERACIGNSRAGVHLSCRKRRKERTAQHSLSGHCIARTTTHRFRTCDRQRSMTTRCISRRSTASRSRTTSTTVRSIRTIFRSSAVRSVRRRPAASATSVRYGSDKSLHRAARFSVSESVFRA
jgi:hypothetical protein